MGSVEHAGIREVGTKPRPRLPELAIPRILHRIWLGSPMPAESERFWAEWGRLHPDWSLQTWTERNLPPLRNYHEFDRAEQLTAGNVWQLRSDIVRYELLEVYGGVYVDCDMEPRRALDGLLVDVDCFAAWELQDVWVNNAIMGAVQGHPFIRALIEHLPASIALHKAKRPNHASGPVYLTRTHRLYPRQLHVFDRDLFYPYSWCELDRRDDETFPDAYAVHHWHNQRSRRGRP